MGLLSAAIGNFAGSLYDDYRQRKSDKRQYKYNSWLQEDNQAFQKYMAENAHQLEMEDLEKANLNPALTAHQSTAGSIASSSAAQGTGSGTSVSRLAGIVDTINNLRTTNANIDNLNKQGNAALKNADANMLNAQTNASLAGKGTAGKLLGTEVIDKIKNWFSQPMRERGNQNTAAVKKAAKTGNPFAQALTKK